MVEEVVANFRTTLQQKQSRWENAKFEWVSRLSNMQKGVLGEDIAKAFFLSNGWRIEPRSSKQHDFYVCNFNYRQSVENKLSCQNEDGSFKWLSIRLKEDYQKLSLVGMYPDRVRMWAFTKDELLAQHEKRPFGYSNGGANHGSHIYISVSADKIPDWMCRWEVFDKQLKIAI